MNIEKFSKTNYFIKKEAQRLLIGMGHIEGMISALESFLEYDEEKKDYNKCLFYKLNEFLTSFSYDYQDREEE